MGRGGSGGKVVYRKRGPPRRRRLRHEGSSDDDDDDEEYTVGEEDSEADLVEEEEFSEEELEEEHESSDAADEDEDDEEDEELEFSGSEGNWSGSDKMFSEEEDEFDEQLSKKIGGRKAPSRAKRGRSKKSSAVRVEGGSDSEREEESDYEDEYEEEEENDEDYEFAEDLVDEEEEDAVEDDDARKIGSKRMGKGCKSSISREKKGQRGKKRKRWIVSGYADDDVNDNEEDEDFVVKDRVEVERGILTTTPKKKRTAKKRRSGVGSVRNNARTGVGRVRNNARRTKEKVELHACDTEASDYKDLTSGEDGDDDFVPAPPQMVVAMEGINGNRKGKRKAASGDGLDSLSSDSDYVISEDELRDLGIQGLPQMPLQPMLPPLSLPPPLPLESKRVMLRKRVDEKGKEKEEDNEGKPLCGICLSEEQEWKMRGMLDCCSHFFCFLCILEWSKVETRCPVCKRRFEAITKTSRSNAPLTSRKIVVYVPEKNQVYQPSEDEMRGLLDPYENVVCIECQQGGDDNLMLLCDICDTPAHTYCVGLGREVPEGNWYCECCRTASEVPSWAQLPEAGSTRILQSPRQQFDLNVSPRDLPEEDCGSASSQGFGGIGASTLSQRRTVVHRVRILLNRNNLHGGTGQWQPHSQVSLLVSPTLTNARHPSPINGERERNAFSVSNSCGGLPLFSNSSGGSWRHVDGAKSQVRDMVKHHLQHSRTLFSSGQGDVKEVERRAIHTVLAACGIKHNREMVSSAISPLPHDCPHDRHGDKKLALLTTLCSACFDAFVHEVVQSAVVAHFSRH